MPRDYSEPDTSRSDNWLCECGNFCHAERNDLGCQIATLAARITELETELSACRSVNRTLATPP